METKITNLPHSQMEIIIQLNKTDLSPFEKDALKELGEKMDIPGYRPGTAPEELIKNKVSLLEIDEKAALRAIEEKYPQVLEEKKINAVGYPDIKITKIIPGKMVEFKAIVTVIPSFQLSDYKEIAASMQKERKPEPVQKQEIENALHWLQNSRASLKPVNRPIKENDLVTIDYQIKKDDKTIKNGTDKNYSFILGKGHFLPGFENKIQDMTPNSTKTFPLKVPADWEEKDLQGANLDIVVTLKEVKERELPLLDDKFAQMLGKFKNLQELKANIEKGLSEEKQQKEKEEWRLNVLDKITSQIKIEIPELLAKAELTKTMQELKVQVENMQLPFDKYLEQIKKTEKDLEKELYPLAEKKVKTSLVIKKIAEQEDITVSPGEIKERNAEIMRQIPDSPEKQQIKEENLSAFALGLIRSEKVFQFLEGQKGKEAKEKK